MTAIERLRAVYRGDASLAQRKIEFRMGMSREKWFTHDSTIRQFTSDFKDVLPPGAMLNTYIEQEFAHLFGIARGLEIGGTGSAFWAGFLPGFFRQTRSTSLTDYRLPHQKELDKLINHDVIEGSLITPENVQDVQNWLGQGQKVDVIIERMSGGHGCLPSDPFFMARKISPWYEILAEGGILFAQVPDGFQDVGYDRNFIPQWAEMINSEYAGKLEVKYAMPGNKYVIRLRKLSDAPEHLPFLPAGEVLAAELRNINLKEAVLRDRVKNFEAELESVFPQDSLNSLKIF